MRSRCDGIVLGGLLVLWVASCRSHEEPAVDPLRTVRAISRSGTVWYQPHTDPGPLPVPPTVSFSYGTGASAEGMAELVASLTELATDRGLDVVDANAGARIRLHLATRLRGQVASGSNGDDAARSLGWLAAESGAPEPRTASANTASPAGLEPREWAWLVECVVEFRSAPGARGAAEPSPAPRTVRLCTWASGRRLEPSEAYALLEERMANAFRQVLPR